LLSYYDINGGANDTIVPYLIFSAVEINASG